MHFSLLVKWSVNLGRMYPSSGDYLNNIPFKGVGEQLPLGEIEEFFIKNPLSRPEDVYYRFEHVSRRYIDLVYARLLSKGFLASVF